jgi:hypothetical protein
MIESRRLWAGNVACMGERNAYRVWWESQKRPIERPMYRWKDNIKMDLKRNMME